MQNANPCTNGIKISFGGGGYLVLCRFVEGRFDAAEAKHIFYLTCVVRTYPLNIKRYLLRWLEPEKVHATQVNRINCSLYIYIVVPTYRRHSIIIPNDK